MRRVLQLTAAIVAAVAVLALATTPHPRAVLQTTTPDHTVAGILHIHTSRSDGRSNPDTIAAAAARAGLKFLVFTDHGDATRIPDPPIYRDGVLCLDAVEISTDGGHYVAIGMSPAPYPLAGEARDVVEDVARLGGFGIVAHPDSPKEDLRWRDWSAPFDGIEIVNLDTAWRVLAQAPGWHSKFRLFDALITYPIRPAESITALLNNPTAATARWDELNRLRHIVGTSGADAHAMIGSLPIPSYEASFRTQSVHVQPARALSGEAVSDAASVLAGLRSGHVYSVSDGLATNPSFEFTADDGRSLAVEGETLEPAGPVTLHVRSNAPDRFSTTILAPDRVVKTSQSREMTERLDGTPGAYRVEIHAGGSSSPLWLFSNAIYIGPRAATSSTARAPFSKAQPLFDAAASIHWRTEASAMSKADVDVVAEGTGVRALRFTFALAPAGSSDSNAALVGELSESVAPNDRLSLTVRADRPMRVRFQLRTGVTGVPEERWGRSLYLDTTARDRTIFFDDLRPVGKASGAAPPLSDVRYVLLVAERTNNKPGAAGTIWISRAALER